MSDPYLSELRVFSFNFAPHGWAQCNGQLMQINQNQALFSLLGTTYGGDGRTTFGLPNLQGRVPFHQGNNHTLGERGGEENHTLTIGEMPAHYHVAYASSLGPNVNKATGNFWASSTGFSPYGTSPNEPMDGSAISTAGNSQPHQNMAPFLTLNICIALVGIFPSRN